MSYEKQNFTDGQVLNAEHLNHMEAWLADTLQFAAQTLTEAQKAQARTNIGAAPVVIEGGDTLTWDGNTEGLTAVDVNDGAALLLVNVPSAMPTMSDFTSGCVVQVTISGDTGDTVETFEIPSSNVLDDGNGTLFIVYEEVWAVIIPDDNHTAMDYTFPKKGVYFLSIDGVYTSSLTIPGYTGFPTETLDPDYLPDSVQRVGEDVILNSPGGKKFKLTVDDSGTITATEVTE